MKLEEVFLNDLAQSNLVDVDRPPMRIDITGVGQPTPPEEVGPAPADDLTAMATQMAGGMEPAGAQPMTLGQFATSAADVPSGLLKGAVQGSIGLPGDIISLARGLYDLGASGGDLDAFLAGMEKPTGLPTTEDMKKFFDETLGMPLIPEGADQRRAAAAKTPEFVGELFGGGKTAVELAKGAAKGINVGSMAVADKAVQAITGNPQATAMGALEAAGQMSPLARIVPGVQPQVAPQRSDIGFYSAVEKAVLDSKQDKGTGAQFLAQITKTQGVKPEELKWTGLDEFLKGKKSVTKAEIQDYLNANRVDVREVRLDAPAIDTQGAALDYLAERMGGTRFDVLDSYGYSNPNDYIELANRMRASNEINPEEVRAFMASEVAQREGFTYDEALDYLIYLREQDRDSLSAIFSDYTLPGGENYREILLTLPFKEPKMPKGYEVSSMQYDDGTVRYFAETPTTRSAGYKTEAEAQSELQRMTEGLKDWRASQASYRSTHFDQPNILAHMRVNDRVVDGKKTLFIEEIQSDWHQAGRKKGYQQNLSQDDVKNLLANEGYDVNYNGVNWVVSSKTGGVVPNKLAGGKSNSQFAGNLNQVAAMVLGRRDLMPSTGSGVGPVPDAPFKTSWHELTLKRAIQEASEKGYDQIAFTTGKTQVERYPEELRRVADEISWYSMDGKERSVIVRKEGKTVFGATLDENGIIKQSLSKEAVGKPIDEVIGKPMGGEVINKTSGEIKGKDFTVGGKGMEGFYDQILPKSLEKLGKKFDAKVGKTEMDGVEVWQMDITPKMRETVTKQGQPLFQIGVGGGAAAGAATMQDNEERM